MLGLPMGIKAVPGNLFAIVNFPDRDCTGL